MRLLAVLVLLAPFANAQRYSEADAAEGRRAARELERTLPLVRDAQLEEYAGELAGKLAARPGTPFRYRVRFFDDSPVRPRGAAFGPPTEAIAFPGGAIYVPLWLLANAYSEQEFAFGIARAMAHVALRHATWPANRDPLPHVAAAQVRVRTSKVSFDLNFDMIGEYATRAHARRLEKEAADAAGEMLMAAGLEGTPSAKFEAARERAADLR